MSSWSSPFTYKAVEVIFGSIYFYFHLQTAPNLQDCPNSHNLTTYSYMSLRFACAIPDPAGPSVVVTGGYNTKHTVSRYNRSGWVEDLANMTLGRYTHGCAGLMRDGELVSRYS